MLEYVCNIMEVKEEVTRADEVAKHPVYMIYTGYLTRYSFTNSVA